VVIAGGRWRSGAAMCSSPTLRRSKGCFGSQGRGSRFSNRMTVIGASSSLPAALAKVPFLSPQRSLRRGGGNGS
jgi:hypothetical protein